MYDEILRSIYTPIIVEQLQKSLLLMEKMRRDQAITDALNDCILGRVSIPELQGEFPDEAEEYVTFRIHR